MAPVFKPCIPSSIRKGYLSFKPVLGKTEIKQVKAELLCLKQRSPLPGPLPSPQQSLCWVLPQDSGRLKTIGWGPLHGIPGPPGAALCLLSSHIYLSPAHSHTKLQTPWTPRRTAGVPHCYRTVSTSYFSSLPTSFLSRVPADFHFTIQLNHHLFREDFLASLHALVPPEYCVPTFFSNVLKTTLWIFCFCVRLSYWPEPEERNWLISGSPAPTVSISPNQYSVWYITGFQ